MGAGPSSEGGASARLGDAGAAARAGAAGALDGGGDIGVPGGGGAGGGRSLGGACANAEEDADVIAKTVNRMAAGSRTRLIRPG